VYGKSEEELRALASGLVDKVLGQLSAADGG
jgi:hypothetical protein